MSTIYYLLAFARIILTCLPQTGYFHPDEFFQTFEVLAGKVLEVDVNKPWEFNTTFPIRSVFTPYITVGTGFKLLQTINYFSQSLLQFSLISPYFVLVVPRLVMCLISFINDICLYQICKTNNEKCKSRLVILASSFISLTYGTRTFTNTIELALLSLLLYYVAESMIFSNIVIKQSEYLNIRHYKAKTLTEKAKIHKLRLYLPSFSFRNCFVVATITVIGFFNRPTFLAFATGPIFFWLYRGIGTKSIISFHFYIRIFLFALCTIPSLILVIIFDSFYYGYISWGEIGMLDVSINNFVVTPLNFIIYNSDTKNLAQHGLHPRYLHLLLNIPLLFNALGLVAFYDVLVAFKRIYEAKLNKLPQMKTIKALMVTTSLLALATLSIIPHQEARFLIPLLLPFVYLQGPTILPEPEFSIVEKQEKNATKTKKKKEKTYFLLKIWIFSNLFCTLFFGFVHQGGVVQVPLSIHGKLKAPMTQYHLLTSHMYSMPYSLFLQKPRRTFSTTSFQEINYRKVNLHEFNSANLIMIAKALINVHNNCLQSKGQYVKNCKIFVVWPTGLEGYFLERVENYTNSKLIKTKLFYPHFSSETLGYLDMYCLNWLPMEECENKIILSTFDYLMNFFQFFTLSFYEVHFNNL